MFRLCARTLVHVSVQARFSLCRNANYKDGTPLRPVTLVPTRRTESTTHGGLKQCPLCSTPLPTSLPVCPNCFFIKSIPENMTYHEMLGTPYEPNPFVVDYRQLKNQFRTVQGVVHPDRWVGKPPEHQAIASTMSARINEALQCLSDPVKRVEYILAREGFAGGETDKLQDVDFLMEIIEAREDLASAESQEDVDEIRSQNQAKFNLSLKEVEDLAAEKKWDALRPASVRLKYLQGIDSAAAAWPEITHDH